MSKQLYREKLENWVDGLLFRTFVYVAITVLTLFQLVTISQLFEAGILESARDAFDFAFNLLSFGIGAMVMYELTKGITYSLVSETGKHRLYVLGGIGAGIAFAYSFGQALPVYGEFGNAYAVSVVSFAALIGLTILQGGVYKDDIRRIQRKLRPATAEGGVQ